MPYYAVSSGTSTGKVKYIPCSREMVASNKKALDIFVHHLRTRPNSRVFDGKSFVLGGSTDLKEQAPASTAATSAASPRATCRGGSAAGISRRSR